MQIANGRIGSDAGVGECPYVGSSGTNFNRLCLSI